MEKDKGKGTKETECQGHDSAGSSSSPITSAAATACCSSLFIAVPIFLHRRRRSLDVGGPHKVKHCWDTGSRNVTVPLFELQHTPPATSTMRVAKRLPYRLLRLFKLRILPENRIRRNNNADRWRHARRGIRHGEGGDSHDGKRLCCHKRRKYSQCSSSGSRGAGFFWDTK